MSLFRRLYDNTPDTVWAADAGLSSTFNWGPRFQVQGVIGGFCVGLRWFKSTGADPPARLSLWDTTTHTRVADLTGGIVAGSTNGWQETLLTTAVALVAGRVYTVSGLWNSGGHESKGNLADRVAAPAPFLFDDAGFFYATSDAEPTTAQTTNIVGVDLIWSDDGSFPPGGSGGGGATSGDLAAWLSGDSAINTHQSDGLPWLDDLIQKDIRARLAGTGAYTTSGMIPSFTSVLANLSSIISIVSALEGFLNGGGTPSAVQGSVANDTVFQRVLTMQGTINALAAQVQDLRGLPIFPGAGWSKLAEVDFTNAKSWDQPADLFVLGITALSPKLAISPVDGAPVVYRAGWWAPRNGDHFEERHFVDFQNSHLVRHDGRRMNGVLIQLVETATAHLEAWEVV